tara:strand:+ start:13437 stop:14582 length:1146 start_codon:yes stop_codon:yes gene_type:complete
MSTEDDITAAMFEDAGLPYQAPKTEETVENTEEVNPENTETEPVAETVKEGNVVEGETPEVVSEETNSSEFDELSADEYIDEMSDGMFKSEQEFKDSGILELATEYDQLVDEYNQLLDKSEREPEFASDYVKGLNDFILKGGDPKVYSEVVSVDYSQKSEFDVMKMSLKANDGLTDQEATEYLNNKYKLDEELYDSTEMKLGAIELKRDSKSERENLVNLQKEAMTPRTSSETQTGPTNEELDYADEQRIEKWDGVVTDKVNSVSDLKYDFGFEYSINEEQKDLIDDKVFNIISDSGLEFTSENVENVKSMAMNLFIQENHEQMMKASYDFGVSQAQEQKIKSDHNPSAVPETEVRDSETKMTRSDHAIAMIERMEGVKLR